MQVKLAKTFRFEAAHRVQQLPSQHPCHEMHGHGYRVVIEISGEVDETTGFLLDYGDVKKAVAPIIEKLDHSCLNDIEDLKFTTSEYLCRWLWDRIKPELPLLSKITIYETDTTSCEYSEQ